MSDHQLSARFLYQTRFTVQRLLHGNSQPGVSLLLVTWNRARFLQETLRTIAETVPAEHELLVLDNGSTDETPQILKHAHVLRLNMRIFRSETNIGTSGYAQLALQANREWLFEIDDDILMLPPQWFENLTAAFKIFPDLGYLALDVVQDEFTNGAKPAVEKYTAETRDNCTVEFGPTGGWATMTPREWYFKSGGFPFRPHKPFFAEDAFYMQAVETHGRRCGILRGERVYHATGLLWNTAFGYDKLRAQKNASPGAAPMQESLSSIDGQTLPTLAVVESYRK